MSKRTTHRRGQAPQPAQSPAGRPSAPAVATPGSKPAGSRPSSARARRAEDDARRNRNRWLVRGAGALVAVLVLVAGLYVLLGGMGGSGAASQPNSSSSIAADVVVQGKGGTWTNITPDRLARMMQNKDFTLLNVKTPYIGEIDGTDLYIPYDQLTARASQLPSNKNAKIVVYCRSGNESAQAAQTLLDLGYTNIWNLAGGMNAWTDSGRSLVNRNRS